MENKFLKEKEYLRAKKKVKGIQAFYIHLAINIVSIIVIVTVNLMFSPEFHWFWFPLAGIVLVTIIHWMAAFGDRMSIFNKDWEEKKIKEIMDENEKNR